MEKNWDCSGVLSALLPISFRAGVILVLALEHARLVVLGNFNVHAAAPGFGTAQDILQSWAVAVDYG